MRTLQSRVCSGLMMGLPLAIAAPLHAASLPPTTPTGITLIEVDRELPISQPQVLWVRPGDAMGHTLVAYSKDDAKNARCTDTCAAEYPPLLADKGVKPTGDWTLLKRAEGLQWVYQGHPLYTWTKETHPGELATNVGLTETANAKLAENPVKPGSLMPAEGWEVVRFKPADMRSLPDGLDARLVTSASAVALTDVDGHTLYTFSGDARHDNQSCAQSQCDSPWRPVLAPALAMGTGDFSIVSRADGSTQWAYRKHPLYSYRGDLLPGDAHGAGVDKNWSVAVLTQNFAPAHVNVVHMDGYGDALALNGMTLYGGYSFEKRWGGRNLRDTFTNVYQKGKELGGAACADAECLKTWKPFLAPADARANGFWEPVTRADGTKQWAYKGYALYSYAGDTGPGQHNGQATYDFAKVDGKGFDFQRISYLQNISKASGGVGVYWNIAKP